MDEYEAIQSQAPIFKSLSAIAHYMALKCAVDLRLADILHSHENPITLSQLASSIDSPTAPNTSALKRVMRLLVRDKIFTAHEPSENGETVYGATKTSSWLLTDSEVGLSGLITGTCQSSMITPWSYLSDCVKEAGTTGFEKAHGCKMFEFASRNSEFNKLLNHGGSTHTNLVTTSIIEKYKDGFKNVGSLVDVGGGTGQAITTIMKEYPHINGINFDLPHVVATLSKCNGVTHIGGDMFEAIPTADMIFMKGILHNWSDKECVKILKNCKKAIPRKGGKILIVDMILNPEGNGVIDEFNNYLDLTMVVLLGGKERNESEWKQLLEDAGFPHYKIININPSLSLIEASPE